MMLDDQDHVSEFLVFVVPSSRRTCRKRAMTEPPSVTTFVVGDRLPWADDATASDEMGPFDPGVVHDAGHRRDCLIRKISARGATIRGELKTSPGDHVAVELGTGQRQWGTLA